MKGDKYIKRNRQIFSCLTTNHECLETYKEIPLYKQEKIIKFVGCRTLQDEDFESVRTKTGRFPFKILTQNFLGDAEKIADIYSLRVKIKFETILIKCMTVTQYSATFL